jgi:hypothetical protein
MCVLQVMSYRNFNNAVAGLITQETQPAYCVGFDVKLVCDSAATLWLRLVGCDLTATSYVERFNPLSSLSSY